MSEITIEGTSPLHIDLTAKRAGKDLTRDEAALLTSQIRRTTNHLWVLVTEAHDRKAHVAMGYQTWDDYVRAELQMSPSRSYQMLDTGHVVREIAAAGIDIDSITPPPTRIVSRIKNYLPEVRKAATEAVKAGAPVDDALRKLAREPRGQVVPGVVITSSDSAAPAEQGGQVKCPACEGSGKVTRPMAPRIRAWLRRQRGPQGA